MGNTKCTPRKRGLPRMQLKRAGVFINGDAQAGWFEFMRRFLETHPGPETTDEFSLGETR